ncbi:MAG: ROK family protein [Bacteroidales bacterium]|nr:ROK family protein [Bacteroidales bacterium]
MDIYKDKRMVLTLDAGGTNLVFNAFMGGKPMLGGIRKDAHASHLERCLANMKEGFHEVLEEVSGVKRQKAGLAGEIPVAISFAFPGPADYRRGIIDNSNNLPAFQGGVPLKSILEEEFGLPVFINNDGDLFAYGEALGGILPEINARLEASGSPKRYKNLVGFTLGTGFGAGFVSDGRLITGDNVTAAEVWLFSNRHSPEVNAEDVVSIRAVQRVYADEAGIEYPNELEPKDIYEIALGERKGDRRAALKAYEETGRALGDTVANVLTFIDGIAVIGGGITGASELYMPALMEELNYKYHPSNVPEMPRLVQKVFNLDNEEERSRFFKDYSRTIPVPGTKRTISYDPLPRLAIATSSRGANESIALGAYAYALDQISD